MEGTPEQFQARTERVEALFASNFFAYEQAGMVWLDFVQHNEVAGQRWLVSRVVIRPEGVDDIISALSELRSRR